MKNRILVLSILIISFSGISQEIEVTPNGLKDKENLENEYIIIETPKKGVEDLYKNALKFINEKYKNPNEVLKGKTENEYLKFESYTSQFSYVKNSGVKLDVNMNFTTELRFKEGKVRFEIISIDIKTIKSGYNVPFSGNIWKGYPIYNEKNGKIRQGNTKIDIEIYVNNFIADLKKYLTGNNKQMDDW